MKIEYYDPKATYEDDYCAPVNDHPLVAKGLLALIFGGGFVLFLLF